MGKVCVDISMSLDGFIAGPNDSVAVPMGEGGDRLHQWMYDLTSWRQQHGLAGGKENPDAAVLDDVWANLGAVVVGRRMFGLADGWGETPPFHVPVFVLTHERREPLVKEGGTTFSFATDGIERAIDQAKTAAGDRDVLVAGGAATVQQSINAGLVDAVQIHLVPVFLGDDVRLFDHLDRDPIAVEPKRTIASPAVTHLQYRVVT